MHQPQSYTHHVRYYYPHHFVFYPIVLVAIGVSTFLIFHDREHGALWLAAAVQFTLLGVVAFMMRQHYALTNQNRTVRLEMRFRYYVLTHERFEHLESRLSFNQLAALRFASDEELPALVERAIQESLTPDQIKREIRNWVPDHMRV